MRLFRDDLSDEEKETFRTWARNNYKVFSPINGVWHPITQEECVKMNAETGYTGVSGEPPPGDGGNEKT